MRIVVLNAGVRNKGNRALVKSTVATVRDAMPEAELVLLGPVEVDEAGFCIKRQLSFRISKKKTDLIKLVVCLCWSFLGRALGIFGLDILIGERCSVLREYRDCDLVLNSGGDMLSGEGTFSMSTLANIACARILGTPVVLVAESLGYYENRVLNLIVKLVLNRVNAITVREELSRRYLEENTITRPTVLLTADPAFLLPPAELAVVRDVLLAEGVAGIQHPLIGINPSGLMDSRASQYLRGSEADLPTMLANVCSTLTDMIAGLQILLIPHVYDAEADDRVVCDSIKSRLPDMDNVRSIKGEYDPETLKGIIGACDLFVGCRMHATIASTSMLVPTVGIAYSHKMHGVLGEMLGQHDYVLDADGLTCDLLVSRIRQAWSNRRSIREDLQAAIPNIRHMASLNGLLVKTVLNSH